MKISKDKLSTHFWNLKFFKIILHKSNILFIVFLFLLDFRRSSNQFISLFLTKLEQFRTQMTLNIVFQSRKINISQTLNLLLGTHIQTRPFAWQYFLQCTHINFRILTILFVNHIYFFEFNCLGLELMRCCVGSYHDLLVDSCFF